MPDRSTLFRLPPIGTGTALVEGLSRYLNRLATEHSLSVSDLIELDIFPLGKSADEDRRVRRRLFHASCYLMDGSQSHTEQWVQALELATMQNGMCTLTLLPYSRLCDGSWLRRKRAWCPHCLEAWGQARSTVYEPLIWSMKITYTCPFHRVSLEYICPSCRRSSTPLAGRSQPGYCAWCLGWLGSLKVDGEHSSDLGYSSPDRILLKFSNFRIALNARRTSEAEARKTQIRDRIQCALLESPPPTLKAVARELRMSSSTALRSIEPSLCDQLLESCEKWHRDQLGLIRILIEREMDALEMVCLRKFCMRILLSQKFLHVFLMDFVMGGIQPIDQCMRRRWHSTF
jgi:hypothetical protein